MLDKDVLGLALYNNRKVFDNKTLEELEAEYGSLDNARKQACIGDAEAIIEHLKTMGVVKTTGTAAAQTGTIS